MHTILVSGSRTWPDKGFVERTLLSYIGGLDPAHGIRVVQGGASGVDSWAAQLAMSIPGVEVVTVEAEWDRYGRSAGYKRNVRMVEEFAPDVCLAFHHDHSKGTAHQVEICRERGVRGIRYTTKRG